ncbi:MAG TPA: hypothetical protein VGO60_12465 [Iamia sp.]|jgi:hypothetical protein|nr:hypothetical protein [Iamia sp.]
MTRAFGPPPAAAVEPGDDLPAWRRLLVGALWIVGLVATIGVLNRLGSGQLSTPPLFDRSELQLWLDDRDAVVAAFAVIRLVGLALAWYLLVVTVLGLAARLSHIPALVRLADLATLPAVRKILGAVAGVGLAASAGSLMAANLFPDQAPRGGGSEAMADNQVVLERLPASDDVILRRLPDLEDGTSTLEVEEAPPAEPTAPTWTAAPGDHLWHIAEATLTESWGRAPTDGEVAPYWTGLIEANRDVLADPSNPDLIHAGQTFRLPAPPPAPTSPTAPPAP